MADFLKFDMKRSLLVGAILLLVVYVAYHILPYLTGKTLLETFQSMPFLTGLLGLTGLASTVDHRFTNNHTEANGSAQNSPGINATGLADSAANPLRAEAPPTMATPYTTQP